MITPHCYAKYKVTGENINNPVLSTRPHILLVSLITSGMIGMVRATTLPYFKPRLIIF